MAIITDMPTLILSSDSEDEGVLGNLKSERLDSPKNGEDEIEIVETVEQGADAQEEEPTEFENQDEDLVVEKVVLGEQWQYSHQRKDCPRHEFQKTCVKNKIIQGNEQYCSYCYCYLCDIPAAECKYWTNEKCRHCNSFHGKQGLSQGWAKTGESLPIYCWNDLRDRIKAGKLGKPVTKSKYQEAPVPRASDALPLWQVELQQREESSRNEQEEARRARVSNGWGSPDNNGWNSSTWNNWGVPVARNNDCALLGGGWTGEPDEATELNQAPTFWNTGAPCATHDAQTEVQTENYAAEEEEEMPTEPRQEIQREEVITIESDEDNRREKETDQNTWRNSHQNWRNERAFRMGITPRPTNLMAQNQPKSPCSSTSSDRIYRNRRRTASSDELGPVLKISRGLDYSCNENVGEPSFTTRDSEPGRPQYRGHNNFRGVNRNGPVHSRHGKTVFNRNNQNATPLGQTRAPFNQNNRVPPMNFSCPPNRDSFAPHRGRPHNYNARQNRPNFNHQPHYYNRGCRDDEQEPVNHGQQFYHGRPNGRQNRGASGHNRGFQRHSRGWASKYESPNGGPGQAMCNQRFNNQHKPPSETGNAPYDKTGHLQYDSPGDLPHNNQGDLSHDDQGGLPYDSQGGLPHDGQGDYPQDGQGDCRRDDQVDYRHDGQGGSTHDGQGGLPYDGQGDFPHDGQGDYPHDGQGDYPHDDQGDYPHGGPGNYPHDVQGDYPHDGQGGLQHHQPDGYHGRGGPSHRDQRGIQHRRQGNFQQKRGQSSQRGWSRGRGYQAHQKNRRGRFQVPQSYAF